MKELIKNSRVIGYLEKIYRQLNIDKFDGELEEPIITVQSSTKAYGHVTCSKEWTVKDSQKYELNISAEYLKRPIENVVSTMLHEMVHIYNLMHNIQDTSRGNIYHNKRFKEKAESVGLIIEYNDRIGYSIISPSEELLDYIIENGWTDILINKGKYETDNGNQTMKPKEKKPSSTRKYICPCCGNSVRATKTINIICGDCNKTMQTA